MPGGFPLGLDICGGIDAGSNFADSDGITLTTGGGSGVLGAYGQLIASTVRDACWVIVQLNMDPATGIVAAFDIAVGAAGSEIIIASQLQANAVGDNARSNYGFPCNIPAGTRIAARAASSRAVADSVNISILLFDGAFTQMEGASGIDNIGFSLSSMSGTSLDPGATTNTKGAYSQLIASTTKDYLGFIASIDSLDAAGTGFPSWLVDIAVGSAGSELIIVPNLVCSRTQVASFPNPAPILPVSIPGGTRISARCQCTINTAGARNIGLTLYGIYQ